MENLIERLVITSDTEEILITDLPPYMLQNLKREKLKKGKLKEIIANVERRVIKEQMEESKTTRRAAKELGISQSALVKKMQKLGL